MSEEEKINRLLNSIAKGCDGGIADEVKEIIDKQQKEVEEKNKDIKKLNDLLMLSELDYISKDKIRELIKKYRILNNGQIEGLYDKEILALQELLEEK